MLPPGRAQGLRDGLLIALTFAAGVVDAVSYLGLGQIFTANMTGNTIFLALAVAGGDLFTALHSVDALIGFSLGAIVAGRMLGPRKGGNLWPAAVTWVLWGELAFVGAFSLGWAITGGRPGGNTLYLLVGLISFGMGLQSAAARHLSVPGVTTTTITTALIGVMAEFAALGISGPDERRWTAAILALFAGAGLGGLLMFRLRAVAPVLTTGAVTVVCLLATLYLLGPSLSSRSQTPG